MLITACSTHDFSVTQICDAATVPGGGCGIVGSQNVDWHPGWERLAPDVYIGVAATGNPADVEQALTMLGDSRWGDIHYFAVSSLDEENLFIHADGVRAVDDVVSLIADIRSLGQPFDAALITVFV